MIDYEKRLVEVDEVLKHLPDEEFRRIPQDIIQTIRENKHKSYQWEYDNHKKVTEKNLPNDTVAILSYLNTEFILTNEQKALMHQIHDFNENKNSKF